MPRDDWDLLVCTIWIDLLGLGQFSLDVPLFALKETYNWGCEKIVCLPVLSIYLEFLRGNVL